ncbi:unnamed protein product [Arctia plantaginis]|uniref:Major facilitator superfamily (MFS) profile domain-containing protein n=2 Tax=Arctia plantaginis TaxID=874455 RepID=A0A8S1AQF7_ARCPL|nr:unnamed protein product [Arctia plantaginis]
MSDKINTVSKTVEIEEDRAADLDQALAVAGVGIYNIKYCLVLALFLIAPIIETVGYSFVLPAAICDLNMTTSQRGFVSSIPYIGIVLTAFPWGYFVDTKGRKWVLIYSSLMSGVLSVVSGFMPDLITFALFKFLTSLCIGCPAAVPYTYIGEIVPGKYKDLILSVTNSMQILGSALVPLFAWAILPLDFRVDFGSYIFRPWRLLTMVYGLLFILAPCILAFGPESPKYLVSQGRYDEALQVLRTIYTGNTKKSPDDYPIKRLAVPPDQIKKTTFVKSLKEQSWPLLKPPYLKWMCLNGFLLFGVCSVLNGLYMWVPDILNRVLTGGGEGKTACQVILDRLEELTPEDAPCVDTIESVTFVINSVANVSCAAIAIVVSSTVKIIGKKLLLNLIFAIIGIFSILINFITQDMVFAVLLSSLPLMGLAIGPINAYAVDIFPTNLRGMAVSLSMMVGRMGSIFGTNVAGVLINAVCEVTFYFFGGLLLLCSLLSLLLPGTKKSVPEKSVKEITTRL